MEREEQRRERGDGRESRYVGEARQEVCRQVPIRYSWDAEW